MNEWYRTIASKVKEKKILLLAGTVGFIVLIFAFLFSLQQSAENTRTTLSTPTPSTNGPAAGTQRSRQAPNVIINTYDMRSRMPTIPTSLYSYQFKTNYSPEEVKQLASTFSLSELLHNTDPQTITYMNLNDPEKLGSLAFNLRTGAYAMQFYTGYKVEGATPFEQAKTFIATTGLVDSTVDCNSSYKRAGYEQYTFVACRRDWSKTGLPIYNPIGLLNVAEGTSLSSLRLGYSESTAPSDSTIVSMVGGQTGKVPPIDFNTAVVALTADGKVAMVQSNLRPLQSSRQLAATDILTPQEAYEQFIANRAQFTLTIPAGSGSINGSSFSWDAVYPDNKATAKNAIVTDYVYAYLENPAEKIQVSMDPSLIMRGTAQLDSGHTVRFVQIVSALKNAQTGTQNSGTVAGASHYLAQDSLKLGSFTPSVSETASQPSITRTQTIVTPTSSPGDPSVNPACNLPEQAVTLELTIPGLGTMDIAVNAEGTNYRTLYFKSASFAVPDMSAVRQALFTRENSPVVEQYLISAAKMQNTLSNIAPATIQSQSDVYALFSAINERTKRESNAAHAFIAHCSGYPNFAPAPPECLDKLGASAETSAYYQIPLMRATSEAVARRYLQAVQANQVSALSTRSNIFPQETIDNFHWIYIHDDVTGGVAERNRRAGFCYIGGISPVIYMYGTQTSFQIKPSSVTYADPPISNGVWNIVQNGAVLTTSDGHQRSRLYYEYDKGSVQLQSNDEGFIVSTHQAEYLVREKIAKPLALTPAETDDLVRDTNTAINALPQSQSIKISLAEPKAVNDVLPLAIVPSPDHLYRIHLVVEAIESGTSVQAPSLTPLNRMGSTIVELGAAPSTQ